MAKVVSWCIYYDDSSTASGARFSEYLMGFRYNVAAMAKWFPEWEGRLHLSSPIKEELPELWNALVDIIGDSKQIKLYDYMEEWGNWHPMMTRYMPLFDPKVAVCAVRDIDSIIGKLDKEHLDAWMQSDAQSHGYREWQMPRNGTMGGGLTVRNLPLDNDLIEQFRIRPKTGRGVDEGFIRFLFSDSGPLSFYSHEEVITRMNCSGTYHFLTHPWEEPCESPILWPVPFYGSWNGWLCELPGWEWLYYAPVKKVIEVVMKLPLNSDALHHHRRRSRLELVSSKHSWIR